MKSECMWRRLIGRMAGGCKFNSPASEQKIAAAEISLGASLPGALRELLLETNGVSAGGDAELIWSVEQIRDTNRAFRDNEYFKKLHLPFDNLLFFGCEGNGNQFAFVIPDLKITRPDIFCWEHETDSRSRVAASLEKYIEMRFRGDALKLR